MAWGWVNDDWIFILGWTSPLKQMHCWVYRLNIWEANICGSLTFSMFWNSTPYKICWNVIERRESEIEQLFSECYSRDWLAGHRFVLTYLCFNQHAPVRSHFTRLNKRDCCTQSLLTQTLLQIDTAVSDEQNKHRGKQMHRHEWERDEQIVKKM